jgi:hypothetical protein
MNHLSFREYEKFSAYLDGQLSPAETAKLEAQLKANPDWRLALDELSATRALLRNAPRYRAPRNFTLSPEVARQYARKSWIPQFLTVRFSAAVATLSLIAALVLQLLPGARLATQVAMAPAPEVTTADQTMKAMEESAPAEAPAAQLAPEPTAMAAASAEETTPPVINWGSGNSAMGLDSGVAFGKGGGGGDGNIDTSGGIVTYSEETIGAPMGGGDGTGLGGGEYIQPQGGGIVTYGGETAPNTNPGTGNYTPPFSLPPQAAEGLPEQPAGEPERVAASPSDGVNPVLGLPSEEQAGEIIGQAPITSAPSEREAGQAQTFGAVRSFWSPTRIVQAALVGLALLAGVAALFLRRRS